VEGDIHHASLTIEKGAEFDGRSRTGSHESSQTLRGRVGDTVASPVPTRAVRLSGVGAVNGGAGPA
jgi:cytoskeletal protein CcmA (bactofilin family)